MISDINKRELKILLNQIAFNDDKAMRRVYFHYAKSVFGFVNVRIQNPGVADEITQDVFLVAFAKIQQFNFTAKFSTWLCGIAYNKVLDHFRKVSIHLDTVELDEELHGEIESDDLDMLDKLHKDEQKEVLLACIERLPVEAKMIIHLAYFQEQSEAEIADVLNIVRGTVKSRLHNAKKKIATCVAKIFG